MIYFCKAIATIGVWAAAFAITYYTPSHYAPVGFAALSTFFIWA